jgi:hypothetical protein
LRQVPLLAECSQPPAQGQLGFDVLRIGVGQVQELLHRHLLPACRFQSSLLCVIYVSVSSGLVVKPQSALAIGHDPVRRGARLLLEDLDHYDGSVVNPVDHAPRFVRTQRANRARYY